MKKTYKNLILDLLEKDFFNNGDGLTTLEISQKLDIQRTNVSRILNSLVNDGFALKSENKRPVVYKRSQLDLKKNGPRAFEEIIGWDSSLKQAVHLAKAAIMYPNKSLYSLLVAPKGAGKSMFAKKMYDYALEVNILDKNASFIKLNCLHYIDDAQKMNLKFKEALEKAENSFLYIDNCNYLDGESKNQLTSLLEDGFIENEGRRRNNKTIMVCSISETIGKDEFYESVQRKFPIIIKFPTLAERGLSERFQFIKKFLCSEADKSGCSIRINSEVLIVLLLYDCKNNIKQLLNDIRQACASAYVRELDSKNKEINLLIMDFPHYVRSGLLGYKNKRKEVDSIVKDGSNYIFNYNELSVLDISKSKNNNSIYDWIDNKSKELHKRGFSESEINTIVNVGIETEFNKYRKDLTNSVVNKEQLSQLVDSKILHLVEELLKQASHRLNRYYTTSIYYGLCLHLQSLIKANKSSHIIKIKRIMEFIEENKQEYALAIEFSEQFQETYDIVLSIDEIVLIAMFLCDRNFCDSYEKHPSLLIAMHGDKTAMAMADTAKKLNDISVYHYDLPLNKKSLDAYDDLKQLVLSIPHERGILVIYDMGSLKDMFNMIAMETGIHIKLIEIPFTVMLLDCCRKIMLSNELDDAYDTLIERYKKVHIIEDNMSNIQRDKVIISICLTGEGGAQQIKQYLEKNFQLDGIEVIALQFKEQSDLMLELNRISKGNDIICIIGTFDPKIYGVPFVPIENVFNSYSNDVNTLLTNNSMSVDKQEYLGYSNVIFEHLKEELHNVDSSCLQRTLTDFIFNIENEYGTPIDMNEKIGLLVHLSCAIDKLKGGNISTINPYKSDILKRNNLLYRLIKKQASSIEEDFSIELNDDEIANIICIIKKSKKG